MFEDSLFASDSISNPQQGWTAFVSFLIQTFLIGTLVALPLLFTQALPLTHWTDHLTVPPSAGPPRAEELVRSTTRPPDSDMYQGRLLQPREILHDVMQVTDERPPVSAFSGPGTGVYGSLGPDNVGNNIMSTLLNSAHPSGVHPTLTNTKPLVVSRGVSEGLLIHQVRPVYPPICIAGHIQGDVILQAVIGKDGTIQNLHAVSGHPMLIKAAMDAVQQWRYRPYMLNGEPVEVETQVRVSFTIS